jgi:hypothetical protein
MTRHVLVEAIAETPQCGEIILQASRWPIRPHMTLLSKGSATKRLLSKFEDFWLIMVSLRVL